MSPTHAIGVRCNPANPVNYLACCGMFDLLSRLDDSAFGHWETQPPVRFMLQSAVPEKEFVGLLLEALCSRENWRFETMPGSEEVIRIQLEFGSANSTRTPVALDWWYETLKPSLAVESKSAWKMYAGQQTVEAITQDMIDICQAIRSSISPMESLSALLEATMSMTGRFGLDPRSSRNALDVGYSANDLHMAVATYPFTEILAMLGANAFFPHRTGEAASITSTRGWIQREGLGRGFQYRLWPDPLPVNLARLAASTSNHPGTVTLFSVRAYRKNYSNLTLATPAQIPGHIL